MQIAILSNIVRKGLTDKVTFEQKLEGDQRNMTTEQYAIILL